jgi:hypothetical protein
MAKTARSAIRKAKSSAIMPVSNPSRMVRPLTRVILMVRAGGRCEFDGCNEYLLEHHVTLTEGNFAQLAHIVAFRPDGPRGRSGKRPKNINDADNLMVLCGKCHDLIDDHPEEYSKRTLQEYKRRHEDHIRHVTGLRPERKTAILVFTACIGEQNAYIPFDQILEALAPRYPIARPGKVIDLNALRMEDPASVGAGCETIRREVSRVYDVGGDVDKAKHLSVFALAPIPLLVFLGTQLSNKIPTDLFQRHRDLENWTWKRGLSSTKYSFKKIRDGTAPGKVAVMLSLSGTIRPRDLPGEIDRQYSLYELTLSGTSPRPTFLRTMADLEEFRLAYQDGLAALMRDHPGMTQLHLFPAVPAPVAILCGRELLPKVHPELLVYDFNKSKNNFTYQLTVNTHEQ